MRRAIFIWAANATTLLLMGCAGTGDPSVDSIGFDPNRAERERIAPRRAALDRELDSTEAAHIRAVGLRQRIGEEDARGAEHSRRIEALRRDLEAARRQRADLDTDLANAREAGSKTDALLERRNRAQAEVDRLSSTLKKLLSSE